MPDQRAVSIRERDRIGGGEQPTKPIGLGRHGGYNEKKSQGRMGDWGTRKVVGKTLEFLLECVGNPETDPPFLGESRLKRGPLPRRGEV